MKVLFVNNFRYRGGGEEFLLELLPGLIRKGIDIGLVCRPDTPLTTMFYDYPVTIYPVEKSGAKGAGSFVKIARIVREGKYEIICIQRGHDIVQAWIAALLSGTRPRLVYTVHIADFMKSRFLLSRMDGIVTISHHIKARLGSFYPKISARTTIIPHGINLDMFDGSRRTAGAVRNFFGLQQDVPLLSTSGSMWKNQIEFLDALVDIKKEVPNVRYLLLTPMADMPQLREFKTRAEQLGIGDSILWHDALPKDDMPSYYADIDVAISTFRNEGFGIWVIESLAMGTPVIAFNEGGVRDALEGCPAGVLIENGAKEMAAEVIRLLKDDVVRKRMSKAGPLWVAERFSRERMIEEYYRYFESLTIN